MLKAVRAHLRFANVASALALFIALGGSAYALSLGKNDVRSKNIAPRAVKKSDLHRNAVTKPKVANNAIGSREVGDDSLTGADLSEATLDSSIQRSVLNACGAGQAINSLSPQGVASCATIPGAVDLSGLQSQIDALVAQVTALQGQVASLQGQVDALCDQVLPAIESNFDLLDSANLPLLGGLVGNVVLPDLPATLPSCP
jgi:hypothetical protein